MSFWRPAREDIRAMLLVALIPILLALPQLTPWLKADPLYYTANIAFDHGAVIQRGVPYIDPNNGFQTQALGRRAALDWVSGEVPWWNPYSGIGMPLAAEYQPSAFFPLTLLLLLPRGMVLLQMSLQILAGLGTYALLRQLGVGRLAATMGGIVYGVNGTLAWFAHGPAAPVPFLPWFLYGIERAFVAARNHVPGGWRTIAVAMGLSLVAGFPETAYLNGLLAFAWAMLRGFQLPSAGERVGFAWRVAAGGMTALAIAAPQILAFAMYLPETHVGFHDGSFANVTLFPMGAVSSLVAPYVMGPIMGYVYKWEGVFHHWGPLGGYVSIALVAIALYGIAVKRDAVAILLAAWIVAALGKSFGIQPFLFLWNLVPGVTSATFPRYAQPSWELAFVILAVYGVDQIEQRGPRRRVLMAIGALALAAIGASALLTSTFWPHIAAAAGLRHWTIVSFAWAIVSVVVLLALLAWGSRRAALRAAVALLAFEAALLCAIPIASNPRQVRIDMEAITFLRENLGLQRFYTTGRIEANYGAYFGIASINHNYLPVPQSWVDHIQARLDRKWTDSTVFNGEPDRNSPDELRANLRNYEELGVKYVVTYPHQDPLAGVEGVKRVYSDPIIKIFELPNPRPYFEAVAGKCKVEAIERRAARLNCEAPGLLLRRELFFPGWTASINGAEAAISAHDRIFQAVSVPAGTSEVRFRYAPPHITWAWLAAFLGIAALATPLSLLRRKNQ